MRHLSFLSGIGKDIAVCPKAVAWQQSVNLRLREFPGMRPRMGAQGEERNLGCGGGLLKLSWRWLPTGMFTKMEAGAWDENMLEHVNFTLIKSFFKENHYQFLEKLTIPSVRESAKKSGRGKGKLNSSGDTRESNALSRWGHSGCSTQVHCDFWVISSCWTWVPLYPFLTMHPVYAPPRLGQEQKYNSLVYKKHGGPT